MNSMRAVVFKDVGQVAVEDRPVPVIQDARDAIVKVSMAALCGSDLHWYRGHQKIPKDFIPGHEFVGVVHEMGKEVRGLEIGDSVIVSSSHLLFPAFVSDSPPCFLGDIFYAVWRLFLLPTTADEPL